MAHDIADGPFYDRLSLPVPRGFRPRVKEAAEAEGMSMGALIREAILARLAQSKREGGER